MLELLSHLKTRVPPSFSPPYKSPDCRVRPEGCRAWRDVWARARPACSEVDYGARPSSSTAVPTLSASSLETPSPAWPTGNQGSLIPDMIAISTVNSLRYSHRPLLRRFFFTLQKWFLSNF